MIALNFYDAGLFSSVPDIIEIERENLKFLVTFENLPYFVRHYALTVIGLFGIFAILNLS